MIKKVVSHVPPRHMDDFLGIAFLKTKYPQAEIEYVHPQKVPYDYFINPEICLVDVGGKFDPSCKNYDHHQNINLRACFLLVLIHEFENHSLVKKIAEKEAVKFIDLTDRYGVKKASELTGVPLNTEEDKMRKEILLIDLSKWGEVIGKIALDTFLVYDKYSDWIRTFYQRLDEKGLLDESRAILAREEALYQEKLSKVQVLQRKDLKILISEESFAPNHFRLFNETGADLIIERNSMNRQHTSVIKNTASLKTKNIDLSKVFNVYSKIFIHPNGFISVIDIPFEKVDIEKILKNLLD
jgi:uncharacterized UPF0160 family protein